MVMKKSEIQQMIESGCKIRVMIMRQDWHDIETEPNSGQFKGITHRQFDYAKSLCNMFRLQCGRVTTHYYWKDGKVNNNP